MTSSLSQALDTLRNAGFNPNPTYVNSDATQNQVIHQNPAPGTTATKGSSVALQVSNGPPQVTIPSVVGESAQQAVIDLENAGFQVSQQFATVTDSSEDGSVLSQSPDGGSRATKGSTITITIGQFSSPPPTTTTTEG